MGAGSRRVGQGFGRDAGVLARLTSTWAVSLTAVVERVDQNTFERSAGDRVLRACAQERGRIEDSDRPSEGLTWPCRLSPSMTSTRVRRFLHEHSATVTGRSKCSLSIPHISRIISIGYRATRTSRRRRRRESWKVFEERGSMVFGAPSLDSTQTGAESIGRRRAQRWTGHDPAGRPRLSEDDISSAGPAVPITGGPWRGTGGPGAATSQPRGRRSA